MAENVASALAKQCMQEIASKLEELPNDAALAVGNHALDKLSTRGATFEGEEAPIRKVVAEVYAAKKDYERAARTLERINLENAHRQVSDDEKAKTYVQIAEYWFEEDDAVNAERYINKAAHVIHDIA